MTSPYRVSARSSREQGRCELPVLDAEIAIFAASLLILVVALWNHRFGVPETLAMLGLIATVRIFMALLVDGLRTRRQGKKART